MEIGNERRMYGLQIEIVGKRNFSENALGMQERACALYLLRKICGRRDPVFHKRKKKNGVRGKERADNGRRLTGWLRGHFSMDWGENQGGGKGNQGSPMPK